MARYIFRDFNKDSLSVLTRREQDDHFETDVLAFVELQPPQMLG